MEILIVPIIDGKNHGVAIQAKKFTLQLRLKNLSKNPSSEFKIHNVWFQSAEGKNINNDCDNKSFVVKPLNPDEEYILELGQYGHPSHGLLAITLKASSNGGDITFFQRDPYTKNESKLKQKNTWIDFFLIESTNEIQQRKSNEVMVWLNGILLFLTFLQIVKIFQTEIVEISILINENFADKIYVISTVLIPLIATLLVNTLLLEKLKKLSKGGK